MSLGDTSNSSQPWQVNIISQLISTELENAKVVDERGEKLAIAQHVQTIIENAQFDSQTKEGIIGFILERILPSVNAKILAQLLIKIFLKAQPLSPSLSPSQSQYQFTPLSPSLAQSQSQPQFPSPSPNGLILPGPEYEKSNPSQVSKQLTPNGKLFPNSPSIPVIALETMQTKGIYQISPQDFDSFEALKAILPEILDDPRLNGISELLSGVCSTQIGSEVIQEKFKSATLEKKSLFISKILPQLCEISNTEYGAPLILNLILTSTKHIQSILNHLQHGLLSFTKFGAWLICEILQKFSPLHLDILIAQLVNLFNQLVVTEFGSQMISQLIQLELDIRYIEQICGSITQNFFTFCCRDHSYKVVRIWIQLYPQYRRSLIDLIIRTWRSNQPSIVTLSNDQYAKYVVAKILQVIEPDLKQMIEQQIEESNPYHVQYLKEKANNSKEQTPQIKLPESKIQRTSSSQKETSPDTDPATIPKPLLSQAPLEKEKKKTGEGENLLLIPFDSKTSQEEEKKESKDPKKQSNLSVALPMPLAFALSNEGGNDNTERLVPEEDRQPLWDDEMPYYGFYTLPKVIEYEDYVEPIDPNAPKVFLSETIVYLDPEEADSDLSDDEIQKQYPNLDTYEDYEGFDWIIHDYDIDDYFEKEWNEEEFFAQLDFESHLQTLGLSGDQDAIEWKVGDNCEVCINRETTLESQKFLSKGAYIPEINEEDQGPDNDQWVIGRIFGVSKTKEGDTRPKRYQVRLPLLDDRVIVATAKHLRPIVKHHQFKSK